MEEEILKSFLEKKVADAKEEIKQKGILSENNALYLIINFLFNHIGNLENHIGNLEKNMATKDEAENILKRVDNLEKNIAIKEDIKRVENYIKRVEYVVMFGIGILAVIIALLQIFAR